MDFKSYFNNCDIHEDIYMHHLEGFIHDPSLVCRLKNSLGASMELGYTFWQGAFGKNTKTYLDRAIFKPSIEGLTKT